MFIESDDGVCCKVMTHSIVLPVSRNSVVFPECKLSMNHSLELQYIRYVFKVTSPVRSFAGSFLLGHTNRACIRRGEI